MEVPYRVPQGLVVWFWDRSYLIFSSVTKSVREGMAFVDDMKLGAITNAEDQNIIQEALDDLEDWINGSEMKFNSIKCRVMHLNINNFCYKMGALQLETTKERESIRCTE